MPPSAPHKRTCTPIPLHLTFHREATRKAMAGRFAADLAGLLRIPAQIAASKTAPQPPGQEKTDHGFFGSGAPFAWRIADEFHSGSELWHR